MPVAKEGAQRALPRSLRILAMLAFGAILALGSLATDPTPALAAAKKVVIVVGPVGSQTSDYRSDAKRYASYARSYGASVTEIYSPYATWTKVKNAAQGANILIYLGHGNGYPSPYGSFQRYTKDGFGLNATSGNGNSNVKYWGEYYIDRDIQMAPNAVVILARLCYASGNSEWGSANPTKSTAIKRVDNYGAGFLRAGAKAVFAEGHQRRALHHQEPVHVEPQHARDLLRLAEPHDDLPVPLRVEPHVVGHRLDGSLQAEPLLPLGHRETVGDGSRLARLLTLRSVANDEEARPIGRAFVCEGRSGGPAVERRDRAGLRARGGGLQFEFDLADEPEERRLAARTRRAERDRCGSSVEPPCAR